jgi:(1->4)-alpha-D-glucan 1-alpha-D-glucosylmutase
MAAAIRHFARKFQQVSAPVMAKGLEDTAFYRYNRLVSLNEVGGEPALFGLGTAAFFRAIRRHARRFPHTMLATSTHDNKRSEDVRARIDALAEMPAAWRLRLRRWQRMNASKAADVDGTRAPSLNDEYLLYQTLVGTFPVGDAGDRAGYRERIVEYMRKATREAKVHTSWAHIDAAYEAATTAFVEAVLDDTRPNPFLDDLRASVEPLAWIGLLNSLSMTVLKHTLPGVPDCYQGNETWDFSLVDPDNRRPVDFAKRRALLASLKDARAAEVFAHLADGRAKMLAMWKLLALRRDQEALFADGSFVPLTARGTRAAHVVAFARRHPAATLIAIVPRLVARLGITPPALPCGRGAWGDTYVEAPFARGTSFTEVFTARAHRLAEGRLDLAEVLVDTPVAVLFALHP